MGGYTMAIPGTRTKEKAEIHIDLEKCNGCGLCVSVCKDFSLIIGNNKARESTSPMFGCIGCGHCMAICPTGAITIKGRTLSPQDLFDLPLKKDMATYSQLLALCQSRRSIREFTSKSVDPGIIEKILQLAKTAPMGLPPSEVNILVLEGSVKTRAFASDFTHYLEGMQWFVSGWFLALMRPFWGRASDALFKSFVRPMFKGFITNMEQGVNLVNYDAPLAMYFYGSPYCDPADPIIAATYAMLAAESMGFGTCMLGSVHPLIQNGGKAKKFRERYHIKYTSREGLFVIFGYPAVKYQKGIERSFASVTRVE